VEALQRYPFDSVLCAINPADRVRLSFLDQVVPVTRKERMAVVGMKALGAGSQRRRWRRLSARAHPLCREPRRHGDHRLLGGGGGARQPRDRAEVHPDDAAGSISKPGASRWRATTMTRSEADGADGP